MTKIVFTKLERSGDERDLGAASVAGDAAVVDGAVQSLYDWSQVTDKASLRQAFDYIEQHVAGRYLYAYWREEAEKHAGPGDHPGTGTPQSVHGGGGGESDGGANSNGEAGIYDISPDARFALAQALNAAQDHGLKTGNERLIVLDAAGNVLSDTTGNEDSVSDIGAIEDSKAFLSVHNHPFSASFSDADIRLFLSTPSLHMVVIGHDGAVYTASKRPSTKKLTLWKNANDPMPEDQKYVFNEWNEIKMKEFPRYQALVTMGKVSARSAWKEHSHGINMELAMVLGYDYRRQ